MKVTAIATRDGNWWAVEVPEIDGGIHTQAKCLDLIPAMVADAASMSGMEHVEVDVQPVLSQDAAALVDTATCKARELRDASAAAALASRAAVERLKADGLTVRDIGKLLGISTQRVAKLAR